MDLTFKVGENERFNVRSAAIIRHQDNYLISKRNDKDYYSILGGRINFGEDSKAAVLREIREELGWDLSDAKLVRIMENFFSYSDGTKFHEYLFVYLMNVSEEYFKKGDFINLENPNMHMLWYKKEDYLKLNIRPLVIKGVLESPDFEHLVVRN